VQHLKLSAIVNSKISRLLKKIETGSAEVILLPIPTHYFEKMTLSILWTTGR